MVKRSVCTAQGKSKVGKHTRTSRRGNVYKVKSFCRGKRKAKAVVAKGGGLGSEWKGKKVKL